MIQSKLRTVLRIFILLLNSFALRGQEQQSEFV